MKNIGDLVWVGYTKCVQKRVTCFECLGSGRLTVIMGDGSQVGIDCVACDRGWEGRIGVLVGSEHVAKCSRGAIIRVERNATGDIEYTVSTDRGADRTGPVFETEKEAIDYAQSLIDVRNVEEDKRMRSKEKDHESWSWNAHYHRREIRSHEKRIDYHKKKLAIASVKAKEDKQ